MDGWVDEWMDGLIDGWMGGSKSRLKDCLQQSKILIKRNKLMKFCSLQFTTNFL